MQKLKLLKWMLLGILSPLQISCVTPPPDVPVFEHLAQHLGTDPITGHTILKPSPACMAAINEPECGHGVFIMSQKEIYVGEAGATQFKNKPWSQLRRESVYLPAAESYAPLASFIINTCDQNNCSEEVNRFKIRLDELSSIGSIFSLTK